MYGITNETPDSNVSIPIPTGINSNVVLKSVVFESLNPDKPKTLQYIFADSNGRELRHISWPVDADREKSQALSNPRKHNRDNKSMGFVKGEVITPEQAVIVAANNFNVFNKHILTKFVSNEEIVTAQKNVVDYNTFAQSVVSLLQPEVTANVLLRLKVILDYQEKYNVLPKYPPFVELMSTEPSGLNINPQYDKLTPTAVAADDPTSFNVEEFESTTEDVF